MNFFRKTLIATALVAAAAVPALAAGGGEIETGRYMYVAPNGTMTYVDANAKATTMLMKHAKPVTAGQPTMSFEHTDTASWAKGDYRAEVWAGDEKVNDQHFQIVDKAKAGK